MTYSYPSAALLNWILCNETDPEHKWLHSQLQLGSLRLNHFVCDVGEVLTDVYFPIRGALSIMAVTSDGEGIEITSVAKEGRYGYIPCAEVTCSSYRVVVQSAGQAYRVALATLRVALKRDDRLRRAPARAEAIFLACASQSAACNALHPITRRRCRRPLESTDRIGASDFALTHESLVLRLGVRSLTLTDILSPLSERSFIVHQRGKTTNIDRLALEELSCECYLALKIRLDHFKCIASPFARGT